MSPDPAIQQEVHQQLYARTHKLINAMHIGRDGWIVSPAIFEALNRSCQVNTVSESNPFRRPTLFSEPVQASSLLPFWSKKPRPSRLRFAERCRQRAEQQRNQKFKNSIQSLEKILNASAGKQ